MARGRYLNKKEKSSASAVSSAVEGFSAESHVSVEQPLDQTIVYTNSASASRNPARRQLSKAVSKDFSVAAGSIPPPSSTCSRDEVEKLADETYDEIELAIAQQPSKGILKRGDTQALESKPPGHAQAEKDREKSVRLAPPPRRNGKIEYGQYLYSESLENIRRGSIQMVGVGTICTLVS